VPIRLAMSSTPEVTDLTGIVLPDAGTGALFDLGAGPSLALVSVIRHRY